MHVRNVSWETGLSLVLAKYFDMFVSTFVIVNESYELEYRCSKRFLSVLHYTVRLWNMLSFSLKGHTISRRHERMRECDTVIGSVDRTSVTTDQ